MMSCGDKRTHKVYYSFVCTFHSRIARVSGIPGGGGDGKEEKRREWRKGETDFLSLACTQTLFYFSFRSSFYHTRTTDFEEK